MPKKSGRVTFDDRGNSHWEWQTDSGKFETDIDSKKLKKLIDAPLSITDKDATPKSGFDPYDNTAQSPPDKSTSKRRKSLDDLRKLSEHIKNSKHWKNDKD